MVTIAGVRSAGPAAGGLCRAVQSGAIWDAPGSSMNRALGIARATSLAIAIAATVVFFAAHNRGGNRQSELRG